MGTLIFIWTVIKAVLGISFVIFWHELGHFLLAKWNGVYVKTFSVGFPPRLVRLFRYKETDYVLGSVPLGGYVHMLGEDEGQTEPPTGSPGETDAEGQPRSNIEPSLANHPGAFFNKSVWARMAIISAGVIMNVLLGLICFTVVYMVGGRLEAPATIGAVVPGGPAYRDGLLPGDSVRSINGEPVTFEDLNRLIIHSGPGEVFTFEVDRPGVAEPITLDLHPERSLREEVPQIRVSNPMSLELAPALPYVPLPGVEGEVEGEIVAGGRITRAGPAGGETVAIDSPFALQDLLDRYRDLPVRIEMARPDQKATPDASADSGGAVEPKASATSDAETATVPPVRFLDFGLRMQAGPIVALRAGSPAEEAGLRPGDLILAVDGDREFDLVRLPSFAADRIGEPVELTISRDDEEQTVAVTPVDGESWTQVLGNATDTPLNVDTMGLALRIDTKVIGVRDGSPAAKAGITPGDQLLGIRFTWEPLQDGEEPRVEELTFDDRTTWVYAFDMAQRFEARSIELTTKTRSTPAAIVPEAVEGWYYPSRGLRLMPDLAPIPPMGLADSLSRAGSETLGVITSFYTLLQRLGQGQVGTKGLSGPIRIAKAMFDFAGVDFITFLYFLGFISINLAVVNFLPIPPLDGGRMVFLIGEAVRGRPLPDSWQALPTYLGILFLLGLMVFVLIQDTIVTFF